jgi:hypothetical protein
LLAQGVCEFKIDLPSEVSPHFGQNRFNNTCFYFGSDKSIQEQDIRKVGANREMQRREQPVGRSYREYLIPISKMLNTLPLISAVKVKALEFSDEEGFETELVRSALLKIRYVEAREQRMIFRRSLKRCYEKLDKMLLEQVVVKSTVWLSFGCWV